jgi:alcohol dehydrogenase class IV
MTVLDGATPFRWQDGERLIVFGRAQLNQARAMLPGPYALLTTPRAEPLAPELRDAAESVHHIEPGRVDELAAALRPQVRAEVLVALGGGRVIDVAKALAAADPPRRVAAIPTTLSGAEMTAIHRHAAGVAPGTPRVRAAFVINDPELSASQPERALAESAANALSHAFEGPLTPLANPVASLAASQSVRLIAAALADGTATADRDALALGALLAGYVIDSTGYGLHHVLSQTLVRFAGVSHGGANAIMLPHTLEALGRRAPAETEHFSALLDEDPTRFAERVCALTGVTRLRDAGVDAATLDECARQAATRQELHATPPAADERELRQLYEAAY